MTPATMFYGDLRVLASDAVQMAENAYKKGQADEREQCAALIESRKTGANELMDAVRDMEAKAIRARGQS